ncbi:hypothetical protein SLE2022_166690 [Rubroshorea leprosula]
MGSYLATIQTYCSAISPVEDRQRGTSNTSSTAGSPLAGKLFVVIGAGGAGRALVYGTEEKGARVVIANWTYGTVLLCGLLF